MDLRARMDRFEASGLYVVITESFCAGRSGLEVLDACLRAGVLLFQLREKDWDSRTYYERARAFRERTWDAGALLLINDRLDLAMAVDADGVHLGQEDLPIAEARRLVPEMLIGASSHNLDEALDAQAAGASYVNIGPVFPTQTKHDAGQAVGAEMIDALAPHLRVPFTCMGGIKQENAGELLARGARHLAVITAVTQAADVEAAARLFNETILARR